MPVDFDKFVFRPRPLQQFDFGQGSRDVIEARFGRERIDNQKQQAEAQQAEQTAGRQDMNTRFSATIASDRNAAGHEAQMKRNQQAVTLVEQARKAANTGDWNTADALGPRILEMGGRYTKRAGPGGRPVYEFQAPGAPEQGGVDYAGTREQIFGGGGTDPGAVGAGSPFQMRSNVGPGGPGAGGNPFERLPGASAAALPPQAPQAPAPAQASPQPPPAAAPPGPGIPGEAAGAAAPPPAGAGPDGPDLQAPPNLQLQDPTQARNPFANPYEVDTSQVQNQNALRLQPYLDGAKGGVPGIGWQNRIESLNQGAASLNLPPEETLKLWQPTFNTLTGLMKNENSSNAARASLSLRGQGMDFTQNQRLRDFAARKVANVTKQFDTANNYKRFEQINSVTQLLDEGAQGNGQADVLAISTLRNLYQDGIMTDKDFQQVQGGIRTIWEKIKDGTIETFIANGVNPTTRANLRSVVRIANARSRSALDRAQTQMLTRVTNNRTISEEERQEIVAATAEMIPEQLWSNELRKLMGEPVEQRTGPLDQSGNYRVGPGNGGASTGKSGSVSKSSRGPSDKPVEQMTDGEVSKELEEMMK